MASRRMIHGLPLPLLLLPVLSTLLGGWLALRARRFLSLLIALGAGLLLGTAFLDLLPEALLLNARTGQPPQAVLTLALAAFLAFFVLDSVLDRVSLHRNVPTARRTLGRVSGSLLIFHSFRDGMVIGAAFSASRSVGLVVAAGIVTHDLGDGMNTIILSTGGHPATRVDYLFLLADAVAPFVGALLTLWWVQSPANAVVMLSIAAGFFLQMATSNLLPSLRNLTDTSPWRIVPAVLLGVLFIYTANQLLANLTP